MAAYIDSIKLLYKAHSYSRFSSMAQDKDAQRLQDLFMENGLDDEMGNGENIVDFYEKLQEIGPDAVGEQA